MNYIESKNKIEEIRRKDEIVFRMAVSHLMDVGIRNLTPKNIETTCIEIATEDDSRFFMTNRVKIDIVRTAGLLAEIDHIHLLNYISKELFYDVGDESLSYDRAIDLLENCMNYISEDAVKIDSYEDYVVDFEIGDYSFTSVVYDTTTSWNL
jgi:hypothetical protein